VGHGRPGKMVHRRLRLKPYKDPKGFLCNRLFCRGEPFARNREVEDPTKTLRVSVAWMGDLPGAGTWIDRYTLIEASSDPRAGSQESLCTKVFCIHSGGPDVGAACCGE
jgi:hypothetical protein